MSGQPADPALELLEAVLRRIAEAAPGPWYPRIFAETARVERDSLDAPLEQLRMAGLVHLTDWEQGRGQGYALTPEGARMVESPRLLARLRGGQLPAPPNGPAEAPSFQPSTILYQRRAQLREELENVPPPFFTRALLLANVLVFLVGLGLASKRGLPDGFYLTGGMRDERPVNEQDVQNHARYNQLLHDLGSVRAPDIAAGEWWRLLSCCFVHGGLLHLGLNLFALYTLGQLVEVWWGRWRFLIIYLTAGLGGSCAAVLANPLGPGVVGASTALCGLLASVAAWVYLNRRLFSGEFVAAWKRNLIINSVLVLVISFMPGISMAGHLGGAAAGLVVAAPLNYQRFARGWPRGLALVAALAVPLACIGAVAVTRAISSPWQQLARQLQQQRQQEDEHARKEHEERDKADFFERFAARSTAAINASIEAQRKADVLLEQPPQGRSHELRALALKALDKARTDLDEAIEPLRDALPYPSIQIEHRRQDVLDYLVARRDLCEWSRILLAEGKPLAGEEKSTYDQLRSAVDLRRDPAQRALR